MNVPSRMKPYLEMFLLGPNNALFESPYNERTEAVDLRRNAPVGVDSSNNATMLEMVNKAIKVGQDDLWWVPYSLFTAYGRRNPRCNTMYDYAVDAGESRIAFRVGSLEFFFGTEAHNPWGHAYTRIGAGMYTLVPSIRTSRNRYDLIKIPLHARNYIWSAGKYVYCPMMMYFHRSPKVPFCMVVYAPYGERAHVAYSLILSPATDVCTPSVIADVMADFHLFNALYPSFIDDDFFKGLMRSDAKNLTAVTSYAGN